MQEERKGDWFSKIENKSHVILLSRLPLLLLSFLFIFFFDRRGPLVIPRGELPFPIVLRRFRGLFQELRRGALVAKRGRKRRVSSSRCCCCCCFCFCFRFFFQLEPRFRQGGQQLRPAPAPAVQRLELLLGGLEPLGDGRGEIAPCILKSRPRETAPRSRGRPSRPQRRRRRPRRRGSRRGPLPPQPPQRRRRSGGRAAGIPLFLRPRHRRRRRPRPRPRPRRRPGRRRHRLSSSSSSSSPPLSLPLLLVCSGLHQPCDKRRRRGHPGGPPRDCAEGRGKP